MAFTVREYRDLVRLLEEHPDWRAELRRLLFPEELLELPQIIRDLAVQVRALAEAHVRAEERISRLEAAVQRLTEAQARAEERIGRLEAAVERLEAAVQRLTEAQARAEERIGRLEAAVERLEAAVQRLTEAQARAEERISRLEAAVERLTEAQARTEARLEELAAAQARTEERVSRLEVTTERLVQEVGGLKGRVLEADYREKAPAYFGALLRRVRLVWPIELEEELAKVLSPDEFRDLLSLDMLVVGRPRREDGALEVWLAVEVSSVVDRLDVERAQRRAGYLRRAGYRAVPTVAGESATEGAWDAAQAQKVLVLQDGHAELWEEALEEALRS